jgi:hypothetical protein
VKPGPSPAKTVDLGANSKVFGRVEPVKVVSVDVRKNLQIEKQQPDNNYNLSSQKKPKKPAAQKPAPSKQTTYEEEKVRLL